MATQTERALRKVVLPALMKEFGYENALAGTAPREDRHQYGRRRGGAGRQEGRCGRPELTAIAGQKPVITRAKKSIATFKVRENMPIGCKVTLRSDRMYEFLDRLVNIALPRVRDFRGISGKSFDGRGNYALGLKEQLVFPEINYDQVDAVRGMDIIIVTTAQDGRGSQGPAQGLRHAVRQLSAGKSIHGKDQFRSTKTGSAPRW